MHSHLPESFTNNNMGDEMEKENELPKRKKNRLEKHDYSSPGAYFITICTKDKKNVFWDPCRGGYHPPADSPTNSHPEISPPDVILPPDSIRLSPYGKIVEEAIKAIPAHYAHVKLLQYVIMPNHVHLMLLIPYDNGRMISSPTSILTVVGQMKRSVSKKIGEAIWQKSFHDHIVRNGNDYENITKYIYENPIKWQYDCLYTP